MRLADVPLLAAWLRFGGGGMTVRRVALRGGSPGGARWWAGEGLRS